MPFVTAGSCLKYTGNSNKNKTGSRVLTGLV